MARKKIQLATDRRPFIMVYQDFLESSLLDNYYQRLVYIYLKKYADSKNQCYPSVKTISKQSGISVNKVKITLKELEEKGIIAKMNKSRPDGGKSSNLYTLYDYRELWNARSSEEVAAVIGRIEEKRMIEALTAKGYRITKEKGLETAEQTKVTAEPSAQQFDIGNIITNPKENQGLERYTFDQIKQLFDYDIMIQNNPCRQKDIDSVMNILHTTMNTSKATIRIASENKPAMVVIRKLMRLDKELIMYAIDKFSEQTEQIKNPAAYMLTILYSAPEQYHFANQNQIAHGNAPKKTVANQKPIDIYTSFPQRDYDYEALEKELLNRPIQDSVKNRETITAEELLNNMKRTQ